MAPVGKETHIPQQQVGQQRRPNLPANGVGAGAQKVGQLQRLFDLLEENFNRPTAAVQLDDALGAPFQIVAQENHLDLSPVDFHQRYNPAQLVRVGLLRAGRLQHDQFIAQDFALGIFLENLVHLIAQIVLGPRHPEHQTQREVGQMIKVDVSLMNPSRST